MVIAGIALGLIMAVIGIRRGLYPMWATMFNIMIAIYLSVMLTPTLASQFNWLGSGWGDPNKQIFWYVYAAAAAIVAFVTLMTLEVLSLSYFTGTFNITLPKLINGVGAGIVGFIAGYIIWGFICFLVLIMPISDSRIITKAFTSDAQSKQISMPAVSKVVNTVNGFSFQPDMKMVRRVIEWTLGWEAEQLAPANKKKANTAS